MYYRQKPRVFLKKDIKHGREVIGYIQLVNYYCKNTNGFSQLPQIEYKLYDKKHYNKKILTEELPKYLKLCLKYNFNKLLAVVNKDNVASIKLLEKNNFFKFTEINDRIAYIANLELNPETGILLLQSFKAREEERKKYA